MDINKSDLPQIVQKCTAQQTINGNGNIDTYAYVNKALLEADLMNRYTIDQKLIVNDCNKKKNDSVVINGINTSENNIFKFRFLGDMMNCSNCATN